MLKASSSGIVRVVFKKRLHEHSLPLLLTGTGIGKQRVVIAPSLTLPFLCPSYPFYVQTRAASSSRFASRFFAPLESVTSPVIDGETAIQPTNEEEIEGRLLSPDIETTPTTQDEEPLRRMRYYYLPWARLPAHVAEREGGGGGRKKQTGGMVEWTGKSGKMRLRGTSEKRREVVDAKAGARRKRKRDKLQKVKRMDIVESVEETDCDSVESRDFQIPEEGLEDQQRGPVSYDSIIPKDVQVEDLSVEQLRAIILNKDADLMGLVWDAYHRLITLETDDDYQGGRTQGAEHGGNSLVGPDLLITLANRLIMRRKHKHKNAHEIFLRLLSVYARLRLERAIGGGVPHLKTAEWNCLIHFSGTGLRGKASLEAYNASLDVYDDMLRGMKEARTAGSESLLPEIEPDIYTYTTLLSIALRTGHQPAIDHAMKLLQDSGKEPTRITHLCMVRHRYRVDGLAGVRALLSLMKPEDINVDGISAYMVCAGDEGNLDVVQNIYNALRGNVAVHEDGTFGPLSSIGKTSEDGISENSTKDDSEKYITVEGIRLPRSLVPSAAIYNYAIQIFAYYGHLSNALEVFMDMLATHRPSRGSRRIGGEVRGGGFYRPSFAVFRGLFLGFARHACRTDKSFLISTSTTIEDTSDDATTPLARLYQRPEWNWDRFTIILDIFLEYGDTSHSQMPHQHQHHHRHSHQQQHNWKRGMSPPSERMIFWIMTATRRLTGGDEAILRDVWRKLNERWLIRKGGRLMGLDAKYGDLGRRGRGEQQGRGEGEGRVGMGGGM